MTKPLTNVQVEILQSFNYQLSDEELTSFRKMLVEYFADRISDDIDHLFREKGWSNEKSDEWASIHMRTGYNKEN
jgi:hypothetical protein